MLDLWAEGAPCFSSIGFGRPQEDGASAHRGSRGEPCSTERADRQDGRPRSPRAASARAGRSHTLGATAVHLASSNWGSRLAAGDSGFGRLRLRG